MRARSTLIAAIVAAATASTGIAGVTFSLILRTGMDAPGAEPGSKILTVGGTPVIGDGGHIVTDFVLLTGPAITSGSNEHIGYTGLPGSLSVFQRGGAPAGPLGPDVLFANGSGGMKSWPTPSGGFLFNQRVQGVGVDASNDTVLWLRQGGVTSVLFREGSPAPGFTNGEIIADLASNSNLIAKLLDDGNLLAKVQVTGGPGGATTQDNLITGPTASPAIRLQWGVAAPGCVETLASLDAFTNMRYHFGRTGKFIVKGILTGAPASSNEAFWTGDSSGIALWVRDGGNSIPGLNAADVVVVDNDFGFSINDAGEAIVALRLQTGVGDTVSANDRFLLYGTPGNLSVAARENGQVPGLATGVLYNAFTWDAAYNGGVLIRASLRGGVNTTNDEVILAGTPGPVGTLAVVMREGDPAPGFPAGYTLGSLQSSSLALRMNRDGRFAVAASVLDPMGGSVGALYAAGPGLTPRLVVASGSVLEVAPSSFGVVSNSSFTPGGMNILNQIPFNVTFTDGSEASMVATVSFAPGTFFASGGGAVVSDASGNNNGVADPAESSIGLTLPVRNDGDVAATGVSATLTSLTPTVTVQTAAAAYPNLGAGVMGNNTSPFVISLSPSHPCNGPIALKLAVTSSEGTNTVNLVLTAGNTYPGCATFALGTPIVITDTAGNGNNNGVADPGENALSFSVPIIKTAGGGPSSGITATLTSLTPTATIVSGSSTYPTLTPSGPVSNSSPFIIALSPSHPCGAPINLRLALSADSGLASAQIDFSVPGGIPSNVQTIALSDLAAGIPDNSATGVNVPFTVSGVAGPITNVALRFDGTSTTTTATSVGTGLGHASVGDLVIKLTSPPNPPSNPNGTTIVLVNHAGPDSSANNFRLLTLDDSALTSIQDIGSPAGPITGTFLPANPFGAAFNGMSGAAVNGTWTLNAADLVLSTGGVAGGQGGFVRNVSLIITNAAVCTPPSTATVTCCRGTTCMTGVAPASCADAPGVHATTIGGSCTGTTNAGCCYADFNKDGAKDISDIFIYLNAWFAHSAYATVDGDGVAEPAIADIFLFLNKWFAGCS